MDKIKIVEVPPQLVIGMRKKGKYQQISEMIPILYEFAMEKDLSIQGPPMFICHEKNPEEAEKADEKGTADLEVTLPIASETDGIKEIKCYTLNGGKMAKILHKGPYDTVGSSYEMLYDYLFESDKKISGPIREIYLNDPSEVIPGEILTEIYAPIT